MSWRWPASILLTLLLAVAGALLLVTGTEPGAAWLAREVEGLSGGAVRLREVRGTLLGGLDVAQLEVRAGTTTVRAGALRLRIRFADLLRARLTVRELHADLLEIHVARDPARPPQPFRMPVIATPLPLEVEDLRLARLVIGVDDDRVEAGDIGLAGSLAGPALGVRRLAGTLAGLSLEISGDARLEPPLPLQAAVSWRLADPAVSGTGTVQGDLALLRVEQAVRIPDAVAVSGTVTDVAGGARLDATARWPRVTLELPAVGPLQSTDGELALRGPLSAWEATLAATLQSPRLPETRARARAHGSLQRVVFDELRAAGAYGDLAARGVLDLPPATRLRLDVIATGVNPAVLRAGLDGRLSARAALDVTDGGATRVQLRDLGGELLGRPVAGEGDLAYGDGSLAFSQVNLRAGANRLRADGVVGERLGGRFELQAPQLGLLWPGLAGSLEARATLGGTRARPVVELDAGGRGLAFEGSRVQDLRLRARVDRNRRAEATLAAGGLGVGGQDLGDLDVGLAGTLQAHRLEVRLDGPLLSLAAASAGRWTGAGLEHRLAEARVSAAPAGTWVMAGEPALRLAAGAASIGPHCWVQDAAQLCVADAAWSPKRSRLVAELRDLDLQRFNEGLGADLALTGTAAASVDLVLEDGLPAGSLSWRQQDTVLYYTGGDEPLTTPFQTVEFSAALGAGESTASLAVAGSGGLRLEGSGRMDGPPDARSPLQARVTGQLPDISPLLPLLAPDLDLAEVAGRVTLDASVSGSLGDPRLAGAVRLEDGAAALPGLGVKLEQVGLALLGDGTDTFRIEGAAAAGGPVTLSGELRPLEKGGPAGWLRIRGERIDAVRLPDRYVQASPDFLLRYAGGKPSVEGQVVIPRADIVIRQLPESAASPSPDVVVMDREAPPAPVRGAPLGGELALVLGRDVRLRAFGLDTLLEGTVKLSQGSDGEARGYGVVRLMEGKFGAYGKELTIERGTLGFAGPLDDPAVDLRASRRVEWEGKSVTAGIAVTGTANRPESRVYSDPAMSEADAISYLLSGRPMASANANERSAMAGAALSLGVAQTSPITQRIGSAVTLDELGMEGGTLDETQVIAGKQLNEDLYVRFAYGLFNRIGTVLARYKIGRNLSIEAASGEDQSLDLIWSVEKD